MQANIVNQLSEDILRSILTNLSSPDLVYFSHTSALIQSIASCSHVWRTKKVTILDEKQASQLLSASSLHPFIRHLDLSNCSARPESIISLISKFHKVESVNFKNTDIKIDDNLVKILVQKHGKSLKRLVLDRSYNLTNLSVEYISFYCPKLVELSLYGCMFSESALHMIAESPIVKTLKVLDLGRCHLINFAQVHQILGKFKNLRNLSLAYNDSVTLLDLLEFLQLVRNIAEIDVTDCAEICKKDVRRLQEVRPGMKIVHTSKLEDYSPASIRAYLIAVTQIPF